MAETGERLLLLITLLLSFPFSPWLEGFGETSGREEAILGIYTFEIFFLVSDLESEELRSHHSILTTSKNLNKLKNQQRANHCPLPQIKADRQMQRSTSYQSGSPQAETSEGTSTWVRKSE